MVSAMEPAFARYAEALHPAYLKLVAMTPVTIATLPRDAPAAAIYLFSESGKNLYVGRTRNMKKRFAQHSNPGSQHNQAVFAFRLAREATGKLVASYSGEGRRAALATEDAVFSAAFTAAKMRVRAMEVRYVEEKDPLRQALLEIYASIVLATPYNDFNTH
jgi:predicted GIY-YIG superfamily endonuclease